MSIQFEEKCFPISLEELGSERKRLLVYISTLTSYINSFEFFKLGRKEKRCIKHNFRTMISYYNAVNNCYRLLLSKSTEVI